MEPYQIIEETIVDLVSSFLYYDRKGDSDLPIGYIEKAIKEGEITADEIVHIFSRYLTDAID